MVRILWYLTLPLLGLATLHRKAFGSIYTSWPMGLLHLDPQLKRPLVCSLSPKWRKPKSGGDLTWRFASELSNTKTSWRRDHELGSKAPARRGGGGGARSEQRWRHFQRRTQRPSLLVTTRRKASTCRTPTVWSACWMMPLPRFVSRFSFSTWFYVICNLVKTLRETRGT